MKAIIVLRISTFLFFRFTNFVILFTSWLLLTFINYQRYYGWIGHAPIYEGSLHFAGAPLNVWASTCYRTFWRTYKRLNRLTPIQPVQVLQFRCCASV